MINETVTHSDQLHCNMIHKQSLHSCLICWKYRAVLTGMITVARFVHYANNCTNFNSSTRVTVYVEWFLLKSCLHRWIPCWCSNVCCDNFPVPEIDGRIKQVKNSNMKNYICNQLRKNSLFQTQKISKFVHE